VSAAAAAASAGDAVQGLGSTAASECAGGRGVHAVAGRGSRGNSGPRRVLAQSNACTCSPEADGIILYISRASKLELLFRHLPLLLQLLCNSHRHNHRQPHRQQRGESGWSTCPPSRRPHPHASPPSRPATNSALVVDDNCSGRAGGLPWWRPALAGIYASKSATNGRTSE
jgi:hypothetical protein